MRNRLFRSHIFNFLETEVFIMKHANDLGRDPIPSLVLKLAVPTMIAQFVNVLYSIIDRMYIGNIQSIGHLALAGVGICGPIIAVLSSFGTLIGLGGSILMAMKLGEGNKEKAKHILSNCFLMLILTSIFLTILFLICKDQLLIWFGTSEVTFPYADTYLTIYTAGTFFALMAMGLNYFITCQGFSTVGMATVLIGAVTNIVLDPVFIFGLHMGVAGAAIATVIAQFVSCAFAAGFLFSKRVPIRISFGNYSTAIMKKVILLGLSPFLILATDNLLLVVMNTVLQKYGGPQEGDMLISCVTIMQSYLQLITGPMVGISGGTQAIISYNYGARASARVKSAEWHILKLCLAFTAVMFLLTQIFPRYFVAVFTSDPAYQNLSVWGIKIFTLAIVPLSFQYVFVDGLTALGCTKLSLYLSLFRKFSYILAAILLPMFFGARSAFFAQPLADVVSSLQSAIVFLLVLNPYLKKHELEPLPTHVT